jgi:hypothetical protein
MSTNAKVLDLITVHLERETKVAEDAFVRAQTMKATHSCKHAGMPLGDGIRACRKRACGTNEAEAGMCSDRKAITCTLFVPICTPGEARQQFRQMSEKELARHWPSIGKLQQLLNDAQEIDDE